MKVLFRADASVAIGAGHVMRCLTLAQALQSRGAEVRFCCRELAGNLIEYVAKHYPVLSLPTVADEAALIAQGLTGQRFDWCVVDHYGLDADWEQAARGLAKKVMAIDDLADRPHAVDLLLDQNPGPKVAAYAGLLPDGCQTLFGPTYALLRAEFSASFERAIPRYAQQLLVNFGGTDPTGETLKTLRALQMLDGIEVDVVVGAAVVNCDILQRECECHGWSFSMQVSDMARRMREADLCVGAGGTTTWERAALGLPSLCIAVADNQRDNAQLLHEMGIHLYLGPCNQVNEEDISRALRELAGDQARREHLSTASRSLVDAHGAARVVDAMLRISRKAGQNG